MSGRKLFGVLLTPLERGNLQTMADDEAGVSASAWMRDQIRREAERAGDAREARMSKALDGLQAWAECPGRGKLAVSVLERYRWRVVDTGPPAIMRLENELSGSDRELEIGPAGAITYRYRGPGGTWMRHRCRLTDRAEREVGIVDALNAVEEARRER